jgi:iron-sulfur cluster repair protein YtfE (RIC family)
MSKEEEILLSMLRNVNGNDRRKPVRDFEESASKAHRLAAITLLGAFFQ